MKTKIKEWNNNFILSSTCTRMDVSAMDWQGKVLVVCHLYYEETVEEYCEYIQNIPSYVDTIFTVSSESIKEKLLCAMPEMSE